MELTLQRLTNEPSGIFGEIWAPGGDLVCYTAEHNYDGQPKIPPGTYTCKRGEHKLSSMTNSFETFEITGVTGHTNLLFHVGNWPQKDSEGCILVGEAIAEYQGGHMVTNSKVEFALFMKRLLRVNEFTLTVLD